VKPKQITSQVPVPPMPAEANMRGGCSGTRWGTEPARQFDFKANEGRNGHGGRHRDKLDWSGLFWNSMREVGAFEAKNKLGQLLDLVEQGEEVTITRHGKEVARLVPVRPIRSREETRAAVRRIRERAEQRKLGRFDWSEWKSYRDEGRS
jgi:prevent-host-death family protein